MEGLRELTTAVDRLSVPLRVVVFFLMTVGFILKVKRAEFSAEAILPILASSVIILGLITSQNWWFKQAQDVFFTLAHHIKSDYEAHPYKSIEFLKEAKQAKEQNEGFGHLIKNIKASLLEAILNAFMHILITIASVLQVIFVCIYCVFIEVFRLLFPLALACYQFDSLRSLGAHFVSKFLSVMAWPVGFALIERIAQALQAHFYHSHSVFDALHGGIFFPVLVAILVIGGTLITPQLMSALFTSGDIGASATGFARTALSAMQGLGSRANRALGNLSYGNGARSLVSSPAMSSFNTQTSAGYSGKFLPLGLALQGSGFPALIESSDYGNAALPTSPPLDLLPSGRTLPLLPPPPQNTPSVPNKALSNRMVSQNFNKQEGFSGRNSFPTEPTANPNTSKSLTERKSAPLGSGFNTSLKMPRGAAPFYSNNNTLYTTKANQLAKAAHKNNNSLLS